MAILTNLTALFYTTDPPSFMEILETLLDPANPIYISVFVVAIIFGSIILVYRYLINPIRLHYKKEKESLELKSAKLMALFAELDPDPVIRIDINGRIIETNKAAFTILPLENLKDKNITDVLPFIDMSLTEAFKKNKTLNFTHKFDNHYFSVLFRPESKLKIAQIYFRNITELKNYERELLDSQKKLKELSDHIQDLIEEERQNIARGLHDGVGQSLSLLRMKILRMSENESDIRQVNNYKNFIDMLEETIQEIKNISYSLKPKMLEEMGLGIAIKYLANKVGTDTGIQVEANVIGDDIRLDSKLEIYIYRVAQEAINNILKYSKATSFSVQMLITSKVVRLIVSDNGIGFDVEETLNGKNNSRGMGLTNIRERVDTFHGIFKIDSEPGSGTMLVLEIPTQSDLIWQRQNLSAY